MEFMPMTLQNRHKTGNRPADNASNRYQTGGRRFTLVVTRQHPVGRATRTLSGQRAELDLGPFVSR